MMERTADIGPRNLARLAGGLYLINIVGGFFAIGFVPATLIVAGDVAATAHNIQANQLLYRLGLLAHMLILTTNVPMAVIFYELFNVVNRRISLLMVFFSLVGTAIEGASLLNQFTPLMLLDGRTYSTSFSAEQIQALAYLPVAMASISYTIYSVFFAGYGVAIGYLVFRSTFLPRPVGVLLAIGAVCYLSYSLASFLSPEFAARLVPYIQLPSLVGEGSFCLWLLIRSVNPRRWQRWQASAAAAGNHMPHHAAALN